MEGWLTPSTLSQGFDAAVPFMEGRMNIYGPIPEIES
jgi:hypothetical protein